MNDRGEFITLEGIEGVGKSTAVTTVAAVMRSLGRKIVLTREPGGTPISEDIRRLLLAPESAAMSSTTELLLMFAARAQHLAELIEPALANGHCVICDRFSDASYAYQGGGRELDDNLIAQAEAIVHPHLQPQLTLLLDAPPEIALARALARGASDRFERERVEFFERVRASYLKRAARYPQRFCIIDATRDVPDVGASLENELRSRFA
jgi:dTMP kinase